MKKYYISAIALLATVSGCKPVEIVNENVAVEMETVLHKNKLLEKSENKHGVESFEDLTTNDYRDAIKHGVALQKAEIKAIAENKQPPTFENTIAVLDQSGKALERATSTFYPLTSSNSTEEYRDLAKEIQPILSAHSDDMYMNEQLFSRVKSVYDDASSEQLTHEQQKVLEKI